MRVGLGTRWKDEGIKKYVLVITKQSWGYQGIMGIMAQGI